MYKKELDSLIASNSLPKSILLYGEEYFCNDYENKISAMYGDKDNILSYYYDEYDFTSAKNYIAQPSLFGDTSILLIKSEKKIPKKELDSLVELCHKNQNSFFIYYFSGDDKAAKDITKSFGKRKSANFVRFFKPFLQEAMLSLREKAVSLGLDIDPYALQHLYFIQNENLSLSINELSKLALLNKKIEAADIDIHVYGMGSVGLDEFIKKLLTKQDIKEVLNRIIESGLSDEIRVVNAIENYIVQLFLFHSYIKIHGTFNAIEILGYPLPPMLAKERASQSIKISIEKYQKILKHLTDSELALKKMQNIDKNAYLFSTLIKLQTFL